MRYIAVQNVVDPYKHTIYIIIITLYFNKRWRCISILCKGTRRGSRNHNSLELSNSTSQFQTVLSISSWLYSCSKTRGTNNTNCTLFSTFNKSSRISTRSSEFCSWLWHYCRSRNIKSFEC
jgi:hypothetical protein